MKVAVYVFLGAGLLAFIQAFSLLSPIILSFILILLISFAVNPVILRMRRLTGGRKIPTILITLAMIAGIVLAGWAVSGPIQSSIEKLYESWPSYWERLQKPLIRLEQEATLFEKRMESEVQKEIAKDESAKGRMAAKPADATKAPPDKADSLRSNIGSVFKSAIGSFASTAVNGLQILVVLVTVFFGVIFMLMNPRPVLAAIISLVPENHQERAVMIMNSISRFMPIWAGATFLGMITIGGLVFVFMWPIFNFMDALILGMTAGILEAIPFLGPIFSTIPALLLAFGEGGMTPLWVLLAYIVVQLLENNVVLPFIMSRSMRLHPLAVIFSMLLCVIIFGVLGVLIATPLVKIVSIIHAELYRKRFLPSVKDSDLNRQAGIILDEIK
jgi:predicted PurR-regulated permease PerM